MSRRIKIVLILLFIILIGVGIYIASIIINNKKIEEEKENVLNNANSLVKEISSLCETQKLSENGEELILKYMIVDGKIDHDLNKKVTLPDNAIVQVNEECNVALSAVFGEYTVLKNYSDKVKLESLVYKDGDVIYLNPETGEKCNDYKEENSLNGVTSGCLKWYAFNDSKDNNIVSLMLDHNIASSVRWLSEKDYKANNETSETYNNSLGPITLNKKIKEMINWNVEYRMPNLEEMLNLIDVKEKDVKNEEVFFDSKLDSPLKKCYKGDISECKYSWAYDRTSLNCKDYGCSNNSDIETYGYWLIDSSEIDTNKAFRVYQDGRITTSSINDLSSGIRLIVDIQKSLLK